MPIGELLGLVCRAVPRARQVEEADEPHEGPDGREDQVDDHAAATDLDTAERVEARVNDQKGYAGQEGDHANGDAHAASTRVVVHGTCARLVHILRGYAAEYDYCEYLLFQKKKTQSLFLLVKF
jgi:hypothetical protein